VTVHRFFVPPEAIAAGRVVLPADLAQQAARVLRLRPGDEIVALDGDGVEHRVRLDRVDSRRVEGAVVASGVSRGEPGRRVTLYQALLPRERFEWALQKGTEIGVARFVPLQTARALPGRDSASPGKLERWRRIAREAAEQSERGRVPAVEEARGFAEAVREAAGAGAALIAWEREAERGVAEALAGLQRTAPVSIFVGPEGGFVQAEVEAARAAGVVTLSLGPRILRAETAGPLLAALALFASGDMEPRP
jgi:16S rRNA (uracil1498-N3)-methyltransferase